VGTGLGEMTSIDERWKGWAINGIRRTRVCMGMLALALESFDRGECGIACRSKLSGEEGGEVRNREEAVIEAVLCE
jgi:hypothetical protein